MERSDIWTIFETDRKEKQFIFTNGIYESIIELNLSPDIIIPKLPEEFFETTLRKGERLITSVYITHNLSMEDKIYMLKQII